MAGGKNTTVEYKFLGDTTNLESAIKRLASKFKSLKRNKDNVLGSYSWDGDVLNLEQAYSKIVNAQRGIRQMLRKGQGTLTKQDKADLETLKKLRAQIEKGLANPDQFKNAKDVEDFQRRVRNGLRVAHKLRTRALAVESREEVRQAKVAARQKEALSASLTPEAQAEASLNIQNFGRLSKFADMSNPQEAAFVKSMQQNITAYKSALAQFNNEQARYDSLTVKSAQDTQALQAAENNLAIATLRVNNAYKQGVGNLKKMARMRKQSNKKGGNIFADFGKRLYSQSLRQIAATIISAIIQGVKQAFAGMAKISNSFNAAMTEITSSIQYIVNSIATIVAPIVKILAPIFKFIGEVINKLAEKFAKFFEALTGSNSWIKATKQVEDYSAAVNKAAGIQGIDELNKLDQKSSPFEEMDMDSQLDLTVNIIGVIDDLLQSIMTILDPIFDLLDIILDEVNQLLKPALDLITGVLKPISNLLSTIIKLVGLLLGQLFEGLGPFTESISYLLLDISNLITHIVQALMPAIAPILNIVAKVISLIASVLSYIINLVDVIIQALDPIISTILLGLAAVIGVIATIVGYIVDFVAFIVKALVAIFTFNWGKLPSIWNEFVSGLKGTAVTFGTAWEGSQSMYDTMGVDISRMATGGVVSAPTIAMVGEGANNEAVVPLGQSPEFVSMKQSIAQEVVSSLSIGASGGAAPATSDRPVILNIDGKTLARALWPQLINTQYQVGVKLK